jgi:C6 transcription factor Pro1
MSSLLGSKSKQSCWTCRLRRKKCDQGRPQCSTCESLSITCYGYGAKPDWMDNSDREKAVTNGLKQTVKHTSRLGRKATRTSHFPTQRKPIIRLAPKPSPIHNSTPTPPSDHRSSQEDGVDILRDAKVVC